MDMKKVLYVLMAVVMLCGMSSCTKKAAEVKVLSVEEALTQAPDMVDSEVTVEGLCVGICKHGGRKAFLRTEDERILLVMAGEGMDAFTPECVDKTIRVKGLMRAFTPEPREEEACTEEEHADGEEHECCKHEAKAADVPGIIYYVEASCYEAM